MEADLLFKNALVIDGTGRPGFPAEVAVVRDQIAAVGKELRLSARRVIDGWGKVLCPGFVDMHGHSDYFLLLLPTAESKLLQGITTEVGGNCGYSAAPVAGEVAEDRRRTHEELYGLRADWGSLEEYLERLAAVRPAINFAPLVGFNTVRASAGLFSSDPPSPDALNYMLILIRESLAAGAWGLSLGLIYPPGVFAAPAELIACARQTAAAGGMVASHMRSEGDRLIEAVEESLTVAREAGKSFHISHLKTSGPANWSKLDRVFELIETARAEGLRITADRYPYLASFTQLSAALPEWVFEGGKEAFFARLADAAVRERIRQELAARDPGGDRWERIVIAMVYDADLAAAEGRTVAEAAAATGLEPVDFVCRLVTQTHDRAAAVYHTMSESNLMRILKKEWVMIGTDAAVRSTDGLLADGLPHPRAYGTMPRILGWVVREKGWLSLETAVRKMTADPCAVLGIRDRGKIQEGLKADLVLFTPATVADRATYEQPKQYPVGIEMVVVNGRVAVENGRLTGERAGEILRRGA